MLKVHKSDICILLEVKVKRSKMKKIKKRSFREWSIEESYDE